MYNIRECIYDKRYGGKWWCCHVWKRLVKKHIDCLTIEKSVCVECGKYEIEIFIDWQL